MAAKSVLTKQSSPVVTVPIAPSAAQVQTRRESPFSVLEGGGFWQSVGANLAGTATAAVLVSILPRDVKWIGALLSGGIGGIVVTTSPIGTWISEAGNGALSAGATYGIMALVGPPRTSS